jgi:hypothetical protein
VTIGSILKSTERRTFVSFFSACRMFSAFCASSKAKLILLTRARALHRYLKILEQVGLHRVHLEPAFDSL